MKYDYDDMLERKAAQLREARERQLREKQSAEKFYDGLLWSDKDQMYVKETPYTKPDPVNNPPHYTAFGVEVIEITEHLPFNRGSAVKYLARAGKKGGPEKELEDIRKAQWYVNREVARLEKLGKAKLG
jgi:hypothetical protein